MDAKKFVKFALMTIIIFPITSFASQGVRCFGKIGDWEETFARGTVESYNSSEQTLVEYNGIKIVVSSSGGKNDTFPKLYVKIEAPGLPLDTSSVGTSSHVFLWRILNVDGRRVQIQIDCVLINAAD